MHDLVITGGLVVDGTGRPAFRADVGVTSGRIAELGNDLRGRRRLEAEGRIVAPGFIDIHTHYDPQALWDPELSPSPWHGVTSVVAGNCGFSLAPVRSAGREILLGTLEKVEDIDASAMRAGIRWDFESYGEYLQSLARSGLAINFGGYVGHTAVRVYVMGEASYEREATPDEVSAMKAVVAQSLREGALGVSTDRAGFILGHLGRPVPSIVASQAETEALLGVVGELDRGIVHVAPGENYAWLLELSRRIGRMVNWSAVLAYPAESGRADYHAKLDLLRRANAESVDLVAQVTCRPITQLVSLATPHSFSGIPAFGRVLAAPLGERAAIYRDATWRAELHRCPAAGADLPLRWNRIRVAESERSTALIGRTIADVAEDRRARPFDVMIDVALEEELRTRFSVTFANDRDEDVAELLQGTNCILGLSDAGAHAAQICDSVLPTDFLSRWVRDRNLMSLEAGVRKLTGELADVLEIGRGHLGLGWPADVVVFDLATLSTGPIRRVHDLPGGADRLIADQPVGIDHVLVNGVPIRANGEIERPAVDRGPGQILTNEPGASLWSRGRS